MTTPMSHRALARLAAASALVLLSACATGRPARPGRAGAVARPGWASRALEIPGHGRIVLTLPPGWSVSEPAEGEAGVQAVRVTQAGARFLVLLTPLWNPGEPESPQERADSAQLFAELARREALAGSVERDLALEPLVGPGVRGSYFSATDRSLVGRETREDEFRHVLQGAAAVGPVILAFTLLDDGPGPWRGDLLEVVRTARHVPDGGHDEGDALEPLPGVDTQPLRVALPGRSWSVLVDLPGFEVARVAPGRTGEDAAHVLARSPDTDLVASVILSPGGAARDAAACRERAVARIRASVPGLEDLRRADGGGAAAAVSYVLRTAAEPEWHAHAFLWRDGTCIGVHVSKAAPEQEDAARLDAILSSVRLAEDL
jgi:hypothetical protein